MFFPTTMETVSRSQEILHNKELTIWIWIWCLPLHSCVTLASNLTSLGTSFLMLKKRERERDHHNTTFLRRLSYCNNFLTWPHSLVTLKLVTLKNFERVLEYRKTNMGKPLSSKEKGFVIAMAQWAESHLIKSGIFKDKNRTSQQDT